MGNGSLIQIDTIDLQISKAKEMDMKLIFLSLLIFLCGVIMPTTVNANEKPLKIRSLLI